MQLLFICHCLLVYCLSVQCLYYSIIVSLGQKVDCFIKIKNKKCSYRSLLIALGCSQNNLPSHMILFINDTCRKHKVLSCQRSKMRYVSPTRASWLIVSVTQSLVTNRISPFRCELSLHTACTRGACGNIQGGCRKFLTHFIGSQMSLESSKQRHIWRIKPNIVNKKQNNDFDHICVCQYLHAHLTYDLDVDFK